jgi:Holliday junction resolvase
MADTPEKRIKKKLVEMLKREGVWYFFPAANGMGRAGIPDVIGAVAGRFVGIECKADASKKPTALQMQCAARIKAAGGAWFLVFDDASIAGVQDWIRRC